MLTQALQHFFLGKDSRLRVSEVSRALLESCGGSLTRIFVHFTEDASAARLAALLRRQKKLGDIVVTEQETLPALSQGIAQGCCRGVRLISLTCNSQVTSERIDLLAGALEVEGALTSLQSLVANFPATPGASVSKLARTLRGGPAPLLEHFDVRFAGLSEEHFNLLADMVEARARIPGCQRLKAFDVGPSWLDRGTLPTRVRLLRVLLSSLTKLSTFSWNPAFGALLPRATTPAH